MCGELLNGQLDGTCDIGKSCAQLKPAIFNESRLLADGVVQGLAALLLHVLGSTGNLLLWRTGDSRNGSGPRATSGQAILAAGPGHARPAARRCSQRFRTTRDQRPGDARSGSGPPATHGPTLGRRRLPIKPHAPPF